MTVSSRLAQMNKTKKGHPMGDPFPFVGGGGANKLEPPRK